MRGSTHIDWMEKDRMKSASWWCGSEREGKKSQAHRGLFLPLYPSLFFFFFRFQLAISVTRTQALLSYNFFKQPMVSHLLPLPLSDFVWIKARYQWLTKGWRQTWKLKLGVFCKLEGIQWHIDRGCWQELYVEKWDNNIRWKFGKLSWPVLKYWTSSSGISWNIWPRSYTLNEKIGFLPGYKDKRNTWWFGNERSWKQQTWWTKNAIKSVTFQAFTVMVRRMRISIRGTVKIWRHAVTVHGIVCGWLHIKEISWLLSWQMMLLDDFFVRESPVWI